ncbi:hypothetical protein ES319_A11G254700v1 [Gossypium barbadense]|uniref:Uncharacterized protein n=3 Tax=Gossypium TaxID=3633 RepID=A0A5J5TUV4_GOSBA|nr:hypothetical protein ES319_A11G254700v1 [Gossypium barbadense]TYG95565.1 hypothetical protein ES288_A11G277900v1 [Gossypium darwinii]
MDHLDLISMVLEGALEAQKEETLRLEESHRAAFVALVEKERERSMLITKNRDLVANEAPKAKFLEDFMVFIEAIENEDLETVQSFDEKAMMNTILSMMNCDGGDNGGLDRFYGDDVFKIGLSLEEKATMDAIVAAVNTGGNCGGDGGFSDEYGEDVPEIKLGLNEKATMDTVVTTVNKYGCGSGKGGFAGDDEHGGATVEGTNGDGNGDRNIGGYGGSCHENRRQLGDDVSC